MSAIRFFTVTLCLFFGLVFSSYSQDRIEKTSHKSSCFSGKVGVTIQHSTPGKDDGSITLDVPSGAGNTTIYWIGVGKKKEGHSLKNVAAGYYSVVIFDRNSCTTQIENIKIKVVQ